jgi:hypothetical protein
MMAAFCQIEAGHCAVVARDPELSWLPALSLSVGSDGACAAGVGSSRAPGVVQSSRSSGGALNLRTLEWSPPALHLFRSFWEDRDQPRALPKLGDLSA